MEMEASTTMQPGVNHSAAGGRFASDLAGMTLRHARLANQNYGFQVC